MQKVFSDQEVALVLLQLTDTPLEKDMSHVGILGHDYIGQGMHDLWLDRDVLVRVAGLLDDGGY